MRGIGRGRRRGRNAESSERTSESISSPRKNATPSSLPTLTRPRSLFGIADFFPSLFPLFSSSSSSFFPHRNASTTVIALSKQSLTRPDLATEGPIIPRVVRADGFFQLFHPPSRLVHIFPLHFEINNFPSRRESCRHASRGLSSPLSSNLSPPLLQRKDSIRIIIIIIVIRKKGKDRGIRWAGSYWTNEGGRIG